MCGLLTLQTMFVSEVRCSDSLWCGRQQTGDKIFKAAVLCAHAHVRTCVRHALLCLWHRDCSNQHCKGGCDFSFKTSERGHTNTSTVAISWLCLACESRHQ